MFVSFTWGIVQPPPPPPLFPVVVVAKSKDNREMERLLLNDTMYIVCIIAQNADVSNPLLNLINNDNI